MLKCGFYGSKVHWGVNIKKAMKQKMFIGIIIAVVALAAGAYFFISQAKDRYRPDADDWRIAKALTRQDCRQRDDFNLPNFGGGYEGVLYDTHIHIPHVPERPLSNFSSSPVLGGNITLGDYVCTFQIEGTAKVFAFFPVFKDFEQVHTGIVQSALKEYPGLFVPFIMPPDSDDKADGFPTVSADVLTKMLSYYPGLFRGYGEIGLYARGDHGGPKGSLALPPDSARLQDIYPIVRKNKLLVYFHLGEGQQESFERALTANPDINFIFHGDQLVVYEQGGQNLKALDEILARHNNAYYGVDELYGDTWLLRPNVSKEKFFAHFKNYEALLEKDVITWKAFIERHPKQVIWGTDRGVTNSWSMDPDVGLVLTTYARAFIARFDSEVQEDFAYKNAERLLQ